MLAWSYSRSGRSLSLLGKYWIRAQGRAACWEASGERTWTQRRATDKTKLGPSGTGWCAAVWHKKCVSRPSVDKLLVPGSIRPKHPVEGETWVHRQGDGDNAERQRRTKAIPVCEETSSLVKPTVACLLQQSRSKLYLICRTPVMDRCLFVERPELGYSDTHSG